MPATEQVVTPLMLKNISVVIGTTEYADAVSSFQFVPSQTVATWQGGTPTSKFSDISAATWTCVIKLAQDWSTSASFANYLLANAGKAVSITFKPSAAGSASVTATLLLAVPPIGGDINAWLEAQITCGVQGTPTVVPGP